MIFIKKILFLSIFITSQTFITIDNVITMFVQKYPTIQTPPKPNIDLASQKLKQPSYLFKQIVKSTRVEGNIQGVAAFYLGYVSFSDHNGQLIFPRKQQKSKMQLLITKKIQPVYIVAPSTIAYWILDKHQQAEMYEFQLHQDAQTQLYYINTTKIELPVDHKIALNTIILTANPKNIYIPLGATITHYSPNLILPPIYIKKHFDNSYNALYTLSIKQYFDQVDLEYKHENNNIAKIIK